MYLNFLVLPVNMTEQICTKYRKLVSKEVFNQRKTPPFIKGNFDAIVALWFLALMFIPFY